MSRTSEVFRVSTRCNAIHGLRYNIPSGNHSRIETVFLSSFLLHRTMKGAIDKS